MKIRILVLLLGLGASLAGASGAQGQPLPVALQQQVPEYRAKAGLVLACARNLGWPANGLPPKGDPFKIGVLAPEGVVADFQFVANGKQVSNSPVQIVAAAEVEDLKGCAIVFVGDAANGKISDVIQAYQKFPVLLIGESPRFAHRGGIINFFLDGPNVKLEFSTVAADRAGFKYSSLPPKMIRWIREEDP